MQGTFANSWTQCLAVQADVMREEEAERVIAEAVHAVSSGFLLTNLLNPIVEQGQNIPTGAWNTLEVRQGRSAKVEEGRDDAVLLTSPRMSSVSGVNLSVDG